MMTAPERIWAWEQPGGLGSVRGWRPVVGSSDWSNNSTEYIRADLVADQIRAAVQAEREACAVADCPWCGPMRGHYGFTVGRFGTRLTCFCCDTMGPIAPTREAAVDAWNRRAR